MLAVLLLSPPSFPLRAQLQPGQDAGQQGVCLQPSLQQQDAVDQLAVQQSLITQLVRNVALQSFASGLNQHQAGQAGQGSPSQSQQVQAQHASRNNTPSGSKEQQPSRVVLSPGEHPSAHSSPVVRMPGTSMGTQGNKRIVELEETVEQLQRMVADQKEYAESVQRMEQLMTSFVARETKPAVQPSGGHKHLLEFVIIHAHLNKCDIADSLGVTIKRAKIASRLCPSSAGMPMHSPI